MARLSDIISTPDLAGYVRDSEAITWTEPQTFSSTIAYNGWNGGYFLYDRGADEFQGHIGSNTGDGNFVYSHGALPSQDNVSYACEDGVPIKTVFNNDTTALNTINYAISSSDAVVTTGDTVAWRSMLQLTSDCALISGDSTGLDVDGVVTADNIDSTTYITANAPDGDIVFQLQSVTDALAMTEVRMLATRVGNVVSVTGKLVCTGFANVPAKTDSSLAFTYNLRRITDRIKGKYAGTLSNITGTSVVIFSGSGADMSPFPFEVFNSGDKLRMFTGQLNANDGATTAITNGVINFSVQALMA